MRTLSAIFHCRFVFLYLKFLFYFVCIYSPPCAMPDCAPPPEGCFYDHSSITCDSCGCCNGCGTLVCATISTPKISIDTTIASTTITCPKGSVYKECGAGSCGECGIKTVMCVKMCISGCYCSASSSNNGSITMLQAMPVNGTCVACPTPSTTTFVATTHKPSVW